MNNLGASYEFLRISYLGYLESNGYEPLPFGTDQVSLAGGTDIHGTMASIAQRGEYLIAQGIHALPTVAANAMKSLYVPPGWTATVYNDPPAPGDDTLYIRDFVGPTLHIFEGAHATRPAWRYRQGPNKGKEVIKTLVGTGKVSAIFCLGVKLNDPSHNSWSAPYMLTGETMQMAQIKFTRTGTPWETTDETAQRGLCLGTWSLAIAGVPYQRFTPHSAECDQLITDYCNEGNYQKPECACFSDQHDLSQKYTSINLPVTCFGKRCAAGGYRTSQMMSETCHATLCREIIETSGTELSLDGENDIYCAGSFYKVTGEGLPTPSPSIPASSVTKEEKEDKSIPAFMWVVLALSVVFFGIVFYFIVKTTKVPKETTT